MCVHTCIHVCVCIMHTCVEKERESLVFFSAIFSQSSSDHKNAGGWEVLFTRTAGAERVKQCSSEQLGLKGLNYVYQNSWG